MLVQIGLVPQVQVCEIATKDIVPDVIHGMSARLESIFLELKCRLCFRLFICGKCIADETVKHERSKDCISFHIDFSMAMN